MNFRWLFISNRRFFMDYTQDNNLTANVLILCIKDSKPCLNNGDLVKIIQIFHKYETASGILKFFLRNIKKFLTTPAACSMRPQKGRIQKILAFRKKTFDQ